MSEVRTEWLEIGGRRVRVLTKGEGAEVLLMGHAGSPGVSPFCGSADLFESLIEAVDLPGMRIVAPDLPGSGSNLAGSLEELTVGGVATFLRDVVAVLGPVEGVHLLGQGEASLPILDLARDGVGGASVRSCFLLAPNAAAPIGDSIQNVSLLHPPVPRWEMRSLRWAIRRLTYFPDRFPEEQLERMAEHAQGDAHRGAVELLSEAAARPALLGGQMEAQDAFYAYCRNQGYVLPITVFWGAGDPTATVVRGTVLVDILSWGSGFLDLQLVNQCAHFAQYDRQFQLARVLETSLTRVDWARASDRAAPIVGTAWG
jgi:2-hydroxy-6-oxonona-2,4-dienedioate hydrolase